MTCAEALYETCEALFVRYPLAVRADGGSESNRSMILLQPEDATFFVLWLDCDEDEVTFSIGPWPAGDDVQISAHRDTAVSDTFARVICSGVPIPRDGSLFGWAPGDVVIALIVVYAEYAPDDPEPSWTIMPLAGTPESEWPRFTGERLFGHWFWEHYRAGRIISLVDMIAQAPGTVFWVEARTPLCSASCVVARDIGDSSDHVLRRGRYIYFQELREGRSVPPLEELLADPGRRDLAPRLEWFRRTEAEARAGSCSTEGSARQLRGLTAG